MEISYAIQQFIDGLDPDDHDSDDDMFEHARRLCFPSREWGSPLPTFLSRRFGAAFELSGGT